MSDQQIAGLAIVGNGRLGTALANALPGAAGPFGRGFDGVGHDAVVLAVPDAQIATAASAIVAGPMVGHCAGAVGLAVLAPHESFSIHPLLAVTLGGVHFAGASAAIAGSSPRAMRFAEALARELAMTTFEINDADRAAYHAAASIASNFLVTLEDAAERMLRTTGARREHIVPLVRSTVDNWAASGGATALTGPVVRNDEGTIARQRAAVGERAPELLELFDTMLTYTRALAATRPV